MADPTDPITLFDQWFALADEREEFPDAMSLATATADGHPSVRMVLLKGWAQDGFVFYTNFGSRKASELDANPRAALCLHWQSLRRQVRVEGPVARVSDEEADAYFATRPRASRIGAWASRQSEPMQGRWEFERRVATFTARFGLAEIPRPLFWGGYRVTPVRVEFWENRPFRMHVRHAWTRSEGGWRREELYP